MPSPVDSGANFRAEFHFDDILRGQKERRLYVDPVEVIEVTEKSALVPALVYLDELIASGYHAAGYLSFEAGYALLEQTIWPGKLSMTGSFPGSLSTDLLQEKKEASPPLMSLGIFRRFENPQAEGGHAFQHPPYAITPPRPGIDFETYRKQALLIHEEILSGRTYQINYTFFLDFFIRGSHRALFDELGPDARYGALVESPGARVLSFSPELFFQRKGEQMVMKPMKGTAPRGNTPVEDAEMIAGLKASAKERAENSMIVDLIRNDLGRISRPGTVCATHICDIETYPTLHQMTSTVESRLNPEIGYCDIFSSLFPSGSVTGAPKLEAMKRINAFEDRLRGVYTGAVGFIDPCGEAIFNVAIRTIEMPEAKENLSQRARLGIGSGFVYDSVIEKEHQEALLKSHFLTGQMKPFDLIEGVLLNRGVCYRIGAHLARLEKSANYFDYPFDGQKVAALLQELAEKHQIGRHKVRLTLNAVGEFAATCEPVLRDKSLLRLGVCKTPVDSGSLFCRHKTTRRSHLDLAWREAKEAGNDEVLFLNERGELTETAIHNLFVFLDGTWVTPPVSSGLLPGVMRDELLRRLHGARERVLTLDDVRRAERIVLVNSIRGVRDAALV